MTGKDKVEVSRFFSNWKKVVVGRAIGINLFKPRVKSKVKSSLLSIGSIKHWNVLSNDVVTAETIYQFKSGLEVIWSQKNFKYGASRFHG